MIQKNIGQKIRRARQALDLSQESVAEDLGMTKGAFSKIERGLTNVPVTRLMEIAQVLKVNVADFFDKSPAVLSKAEENNKQYGYATKQELDELVKVIESLKAEVMAIRAEIKPPKKSKK